MTHFGRTTFTAAAAGLFVLVVLAAASHAETNLCTGTQAAAQGAPCASAGDDSIRPFRVHFPDEALADLERRIAATRWPEREIVTDQSQGVQLATIQKLARYWGTEYDWRDSDLPRS